MLPGLDRPYCTVYGCHSYGQWFGQLGDGRAMALGEISVQKDTGMERCFRTFEMIGKASIFDVSFL